MMSLFTGHTEAFVFKRPLFPIAIAFAVGILLAEAANLPISVALALLAFGCLCAITRRAYTIALLIAVVAVGVVRYQVNTIISPDNISRFVRAHPSAIIGRVDSDIDLREDRVFLPISVTGVEMGGKLAPATGRILAVYYRPDGVPNWKPPTYGQMVLMRSRLSRPGGSNNPGAFSWKDYLSRQRIYAVTYVRKPEQIEIFRENHANPFMSLAIRMKEYLSSSITSAMPRDEGSVVSGMVLGTYSALPDRLRSNFQKTGTLHLLAASGFNCAVIIVVFGFILARLKLPRRWTNITLIVLLIFYMMIVGAMPSIVRATVMAGLLLLGRVINRPADTLNLLWASAIVILAINPADLFDVGFQLSFAAVLALILVLPVITAAAKIWGLDPMTKRTPRHWTFKSARYAVNEGWQGVTATAAATLGTLPISAQYFNQLSLVSIAVNAIVAAAILPIFILGMLIPLISHIPVVGPGLLWTETMITRGALSAINWFGELPRSCISVSSPGIAGVTGYYIILAAIISYAYSRIPSRKKKSDS